MSRLPHGWEECSLEDISSDISYGYTAKSDSASGDARMLRITDIQNNKVNWTSVPFCEISDIAKEKYLLRKWDLVFARTGATVGKSFLIRDDVPNSVFASYLIRVRSTETDMANYLSCFFDSHDYWQQITEFSSGIGQPNVNGSKLKSLRIPLAPLPEQKRIADKLDTLLGHVDSCRDRLNRVTLILKRFRQSVLAAATSGKLTEDWRDETHTNIGKRAFLGDMGTILAGQSPSVAEVNYEAKGVPYVTGPEQWDGKKILAHKWTEFPKRMAPEGSIFVTVKGAGVGKTFPGCYAAIGRDVYAFVPDVKHDHMFVLYAIQASTEAVVLKAKGLIPGLTKADIAEHKIYVPVLKEQQEIVRRVETLFGFADRLEVRLAAARTASDRLTPALLAKAFRGELVPQDPNDEPASALLARIGAIPIIKTNKSKASGAKQRPKDQVIKEKKNMAKSRQDIEVKNQSYLAEELRQLGGSASVEALFKAADLPIADFYKQLAWEVENGHIRDAITVLEAA